MCCVNELDFGGLKVKKKIILFMLFKVSIVVVVFRYILMFNWDWICYVLMMSMF